MHLVSKVMASIGVEVLGMLGIDKSVEHERVQRKQRARLHNVCKGSAVAICNPALPRATYSGEVVIFAAAPDGVCIVQPERRRIRAGREVYVQLWFVRAQLGDQRNG